MNSPNEPDSSTDSISSSLLEQVKAHDQDAWQQLVRLYGPLIDFWIRRSGLQIADAENVFQEVFLAVARNIRTFREAGRGGSFRRWIRSIVHSKIADQYRRLAAEPEMVGGLVGQEEILAVPPRPVERDEVSEDAAEALRQRALEMVRAEFEARTWQMFWQVTIEDRDVQDVARDFGVTPSAVRLAKSRVLRRLREQFRGLGP